MKRAQDPSDWLEGEFRYRMRSMTIWCFGDSNTYGYDPCGFFGGRYTMPWPERLAEETGWQVINEGKNGRMIPVREHEFRQLQRDVVHYHADILIVMLGTNDLLNGADATETTERMECFLNRCREAPLLLIAPPLMKRGAWVPEDQLVAESAALSQKYRTLADRLGIQFADAGEWNVDLTYDGVHFSEEGHMRFAEGVAAVLKNGQKNT